MTTCLKPSFCDLLYFKFMQSLFLGLGMDSFLLCRPLPYYMKTQVDTSSSNTSFSHVWTSLSQIYSETGCLVNDCGLWALCGGGWKLLSNLIKSGTVSWSIKGSGIMALLTGASQTE